MLKLGVRWNTTSSRACFAMTGIVWMPEEPVPMTATRCPVKFTGSSCGQVPVWNQRPLKVSRPGIWGTRAADRQPTALMTNRAVTASPCCVRTVQSRLASSYTALATRVLKWMSRRRSKRSATWLM